MPFLIVSNYEAMDKIFYFYFVLNRFDQFYLKISKFKTMSINRRDLTRNNPRRGI